MHINVIYWKQIQTKGENFMEYTGIEPVLLELKLKSPAGSVAHIHRSEGSVDWGIVRDGVTQGDYLPALRLPTVADAIQCIVEHLDTRGEVWIGYDGWKIYHYFPSSESGLLYLDDFQLVKLPGKGRDGERKTPSVEFKDGTICSRMDEYLEYFGMENNYYNRGRIKVWLNSLEGPVKRSRRRKQRFDHRKVLGMEIGKNRFGKPTAILRYQNLPPLVGLGLILETFPDMTKAEIKGLYRRFDIPLPSTFNRAFKDRPDPPPMESTPEEPPKRKSIDYYGSRYKMYRTREGYLNFESSLGDMVAKDAEKLYEMLIGEGEKISRKMANKVWAEYMEDGEE